jgi:hypothetical protein
MLLARADLLSVVMKLPHEAGERLRLTRIAKHNLVTNRHGVFGDRLSDRTCADEAYFHFEISLSLWG